MKKLSFQKVFCFISFLFILSCCIFYGTRFLKLFIENHKEAISEKNSLAKVLKEKNEENENFKSVNGQTYFVGKEENNYLLFSNILWRIIKLNDDNSITVISNNALTSLAFGKGEGFNESEIFKWLNKSDKEYSGILENALDTNYLQKTVSCTSKVDELTNSPCTDDENKDNYFTLLPIADYLNIGSKDSYLAIDEYFYLSNMTTENRTWYVDDTGNGKMGNGTDVLGIRPVMTIKANADFAGGDGTKDNPYTIEKENSLFGSYVKLGDDIWRVYEIKDNTLRLMLNDYLKVSGNNLTYRYSNNSSYHNDTASGSIAYYLNNDFLNKLSYKDKIAEIKWPNGYYNSSTDFDYTNALKAEVDTKVALMSIGNIFLNPELYNYFTMTGSKEKSNMVYIVAEDKRNYPRQIGSSVNVIPCISIDKSILTKGNGTKNSPFEME